MLIFREQDAILKKIVGERMKRRMPKNKLFSVGVIVTALVLVGVGGYVAKTKTAPKPAKIPQVVSSQLLFTPFVPTKLPADYSVDVESFRKQETALLFSAVNSQGERLLFSEQSVPKSFDVSGFYASSLTKPSRIDSLKYQGVYGTLSDQKKHLAGITIDDTWVLVIGSLTKSDATELANSLVPQK